MGGLGIRKASEVAVPAYLSSVCATSTGVEAMASNTILGETNPFVESANQRWLAKKNGIYHYEKRDTTDKERASCQKIFKLVAVYISLIGRMH